MSQNYCQICTAPCDDATTVCDPCSDALYKNDVFPLIDSEGRRANIRMKVVELIARLQKDHRGALKRERLRDEKRKKEAGA